MKILFLGDSITAGAGVNTKEEMFTTLVGKSANAEVKNYGVGGTRIARNSESSEDPSYDNDFLRRAENMEKTPTLYSCSEERTITVTATRR